MSTAAPAHESLLGQPAWWQLKDFVIGATGLAYYADRDHELVQRIALRLEQLRIPDCTDYLERLKYDSSGETELDTLTELLTIGETYFFRHQESFDALREIVLPDLIERNQAHRSLRIWSAGCATGAEAYSLAILLGSQMAARIDGWNITILGTDINRKYLATAREGQFDEWALRATPDEVRQAGFTRQGKSWRIKPEFQKLVSFQYHNLVRHPFPSLLHGLFAFDLILCRNVLIYFSSDIIGRMIHQCHECLADKGWLLVGHAESNTAWFRSFHTIMTSGAVLYQKANQEDAAPAAFPLDLTGRPGCEEIAPIWRKPLAPQPRRSKAVAAKHSRRSPAVAPLAEHPTLANIRTLADHGKLEAAARGCEQLLQADRLNSTAHLYQALIFKQMARYPEAEAALKRAIYVNPNFAVAYYYLGLVLQTRREPAKARQSFRNLLNLLSCQNPGQPIPDADELTVAELEELTRDHLKEIRSS
jgi:chemotaxis protein methyltransferase CheR